MRLFWEKGYEATSLADLLEATGLSKSSFYRTFGSKRGLFGEALATYNGRISARFTQVGEGTGLSDVIEFFEERAAHARSPDGSPGGCLIVKSTTERADRDEDVAEDGRAYREAARNGFLGALRTAAEQGEIEKSELEQKADLLTGLMIGAYVAATSPADADEAANMFEAALATVRSWRLTT